MKKLLSLFIAIIVAIPSFARDYLRFTAESDNSSVGLRKIGYPGFTYKLQYSKNGGEWKTLIILNNNDSISGIINLDKDDYVLIRANGVNNPIFSSNTLSKPDEKPNENLFYQGSHYTFVMTGSVSGSGNIMSLVDSTCMSKKLKKGAFWGLFMGCESLTTPPDLPADTLETCCYIQMFSDCVNLKKVPVLPAKKLSSNCYKEMFCNCPSLTTIPEFEADSLAPGCFYRMFWGCSSLKKVPEFNPQWVLKGGCFSDMYRDCTSLEVAPKLPYTSLASQCYSYMFKGCTSLKKAPFLPAKNIADQSYWKMFAGCTNLSEIHVNCKYVSGTRWVDGVAPHGKYFCPADVTPSFGPSAIPNGWEVISRDLCFTAEEDGSTISMKNVGNAPKDVSLEYSLDYRKWNSFVVGSTTVILDKKGKKVYFRAKEKNQALASHYISYHSFVMTGKIAASGDIMSLLDKDIDPEEVPNYGLLGIFRDCKSLVKAPELPAMRIKALGYRDMFYNCTSLTKAPDLPATELYEGAYYSMFLGCDKLTEAPKLIADSIGYQCYRNMFHDCHSLKIAPELPLTNAANYGYGSIYKNCYNLEEIRVNFPKWNSNLTSSWVYGVRNQHGTFYGPSTLRPVFGVDNIPTGWKHIYSDFLVFNDAECYEMPQPTAGLYYNRYFDNTAWETLYVPFDISVNDLNDNGLSVAELYGICGKDNDGDGVYESIDLQFTTLKSGIVYANQPYLIKSNTVGEVTICIHGNILKPALENSITCSTFKQNFMVTGTYAGLTEEEMTENGYYTMYDGCFGVYNETLMPQRWYMSISNKDGSSIANAPAIRLVVDGITEESTSGIQELSEDTPSTVIFTLDGRNVSNGSLNSGFNIVNGKKILVR